MELITLGVTDCELIRDSKHLIEILEEEEINDEIQFGVFYGKYLEFKGYYNDDQFKILESNIKEYLPDSFKGN